MELAEVFGYAASGLVLAGSAMRNMIPLRLLSIASNIAFIAYGLVAGILPILLLHVTLLPLNIYRVAELRRLIRKMHSAGSNGNLK
jgi:hypothetical protein